MSVVKSIPVVYGEDHLLVSPELKATLITMTTARKMSQVFLGSFPGLHAEPGNEARTQDISVTLIRTIQQS